jgi:VanZ family protein
MTNELKHLRVPGYIFMVAAGFFMGVICWSSTRPSPHVEGISQNFIDHLLNFAHLPVYSILTILILLGCNSFELRFRIFAFLLAASCGILNEYIQLNVPGRSFSVSDMLVNTLGAFLAILLFTRFKPLNPR